MKRQELGKCAALRVARNPPARTAKEESGRFLAGEKLHRLLDNVELVLAYEFVALRQAQSLRDEPLPPPLARACDVLASVVEPLGEDRPLGPEVERLRELVRSNRLLG